MRGTIAISFCVFFILFFIYVPYFQFKASLGRKLKKINKISSHQHYIKPNRVNNLVTNVMESADKNDYYSDKEREIDINMALTQIKESDPKFKESEFYDKVRDAFLKVQEAWVNQDIEIARPYLSDETIQRFNSQIDDLKSRKEKNVIDGIVINSIGFMDVRNDNNYNYITVKIDADFNINYIINKKNDRKCANKSGKNVIEYWTFIRTLEKEQSHNEHHNKKCPNCSAKLDINATDKCDYCSSVITNEKFDWVLSEIDKTFTQRARWTPVLPKKT